MSPVRSSLPSVSRSSASTSLGPLFELRGREAIAMERDAALATTSLRPPAQAMEFSLSK